MSEYEPTPALAVIHHVGRFRLTKAIFHDDYTVWEDGTIIAQGGLPMTSRVFRERTKDMTEQTIEGQVVTTEVTQAPVEQAPAPQQAAPKTSVPQVTPAPTAPTQPTIDVRIEQYIKLRDMIKERDDAHKEAMKPYRETLEALNAVMLAHLNAIGGDSVKTAHGTVYKTVKRSASLEDADQFMRHVIGGEHWELLDRKANVSAVEAYVDENGVLPPGVKWTSTAVVGVRRS